MTERSDGLPGPGATADPFCFPELPPPAEESRPAGEAPERGRRRRRRPAWDPAARSLLARVADSLLLGGPLLLLLFAPLAWGSVEPWSEALVVAGAAATASVWILRLAADPPSSAAERAATSRLTGWSAGLQGPAVALLLLAVLQWVPLGAVVGGLSPAAAALHGLAGSGAARLSVAPADTLGAAAELAAFGLLFFAVVDSLRGRRAVRTLAVCLLALGFGHAVAGILWHFARGWEAYGLAGTAGTSFGPYVNRNHFANLMAMTIPLAAGYLLSISRRRSPREPAAGDRGLLPPRREQEAGPRQVLAGFAVAVMAGALGLSLSRGGVASACLGLGVVALGAGLARPTRARVWKVAAAGAVAASFAVWLAGDRLIARLATLGPVQAESSLAARSAIWGDTLRLAADFPLFGSGFGSYASVIGGYQTAFPDHAVLFAHNDWLQLLAEGGGAGLAAVLAIVGSFVAVAVRLLRRRRDAEAVYLALGGLGGLAAFLAHATADFSLHIPANALWLTVLAAWTLKAAASRGE